MTRQEANREILKELSRVVELHPDMRFHQILMATNAILQYEAVDVRVAPGRVEIWDEYYVEPTEILKRLKIL